MLAFGFATLLLSLPATAQGAPTQHSITVTWSETQGTDLAVGFNVYRGTTTGGPYIVLNAAPLPLATLNYIDTNGTGGTKYFYVVTAVDISGFESGYSAEMSATFLANPAVPTAGTATAK